MGARKSLEKPPVIAMFNVDWIGHCNPTFALVQQLVNRGCSVHYFLPPNEKLRSAAREAGATVEGYQAGDPSDFDLKKCGNQDGLGTLEKKAIWPLASLLVSGQYILTRCEDLCVDIAVWDSMLPHGVLVSTALKIPGVSLVTYPGAGSLTDLLTPEICHRMWEVREPLALEAKEKFGIDLHNEFFSRYQWFAHASSGDNFITTIEELEVPLPLPGAAKWADEIREHFPMRCVGCMASETAPHVTMSKASNAQTKADYETITNKLPLEALEAAASRGARVIFVAVGTMALADRWALDLGSSSGGNLPEGTTGKAFSQHIWTSTLSAVQSLGDGYYLVICIGEQADALDFLEGQTEQDKLAALPANVTLCTSVQQVEMLSKHAHVFVTHAGFNSLQESLMSEVPMIAVPQTFDQPANARKIEASGWGRAFLEPMSTVSPSSLGQALEEVSVERKYRDALAASSRKLVGGATQAAERLITMARCA